MQYAASILALAATISTALAGTAYVHNNCGSTVYLRSNANGKTLTLAPHTGSYSEPINRSGAVILAGWTPGLPAPLSFEYTLSGSTLYYDISDNAGNPFVNSNVNLQTSSGTGCYNFMCHPNDPSCYSSGSNIKVEACTKPTDMTLTLCA